ncbi:LysR family transcriptional regulator [Acidaminococcus intestini]|jgi:hypothetical protein|uniref:LysR family transcriptional regulator n=2 Tax=Acidaminococcus intestini TaxID=187327 RepID=UPI000D7931A2|nr:LysR family transcriptional regulator [Acidaminococcus intestini]MCB7083977.1 LysR family transcriptional regulator [Acidaminococcus intestini]PWM19824.1 MAG: hypothetical protein DBX57_01100 [Clostridia bacterium]
MTFLQILYFLKVSETLNYHRAAEELHVSQPSISRTLKLLEQEIGVPLFIKKGRTIGLSKEGLFFKQRMEQLSFQFNKALHEVQTAGALGAGNINLGFIASLAYHYVPEMVRLFYEETGFTKVSFKFQELPSRELLEGLKKHRYDIVFCIREKMESDIEFIPAVEQELVALVPHNHPLAHRTNIYLNELKPYPLITYMPHVKLYKDIMNYIEADGWSPKIFCNATTEMNIAGLVEHNFGVAIAAKTKILDSFKIDQIPIEYGKYNRTIYLAYNKDGVMMPTVKAFINFIKNQ